MVCLFICSISKAGAINIRQFGKKVFDGLMFHQRLDYNLQGLGKDPRQVPFQGTVGGKSQNLHGRTEPSIVPVLVAAGINSVPAVFLQIYNVQSMKTIRTAVSIEPQPLISESGRKPTRPQQGSQQVALGITEACPAVQHIGGWGRIKLTI